MKRTLVIAIALALLLSGCKPKPKRIVTITEYPTHLSITSEPVKEE